MLDFLDPGAVPPLLVGAVFVASFLQAITGIGFGVIAGPALIVAMQSTAAIQVSIVLSFLIALVLAPGTIPVVRPRLLGTLFVGVLTGTPVGVAAFFLLSLESLKLFAAVIVGSMSLIAAGLLARFPVFETDTTARRLGVGVVCGALNSALAMPGPPVAAYSTALKQPKQAIRATTLVTFLLAYPIALIFQAGFVGLSPELGTVVLQLVVPTLLGTAAGHGVSRLVSERLFRGMTVVFLLISTALLLVG